MGGLHVTALPDEALEHCSAVVVGEGEPLWPCLLADFERGAMQRLYRSEPGGAYDLAHAPVSRFDLLDHTRRARLCRQGDQVQDE
jgi:radical SAM superfamily enzyme YgiQ (UPF0313 family)